MKENRTITDALTIMHRRYYHLKPDRIAALEEARINDEVARKIIFLREEEGLSQRELAELVGVCVSIISQLEDADYEGHSLTMLNRIAVAISHDLAQELLPPIV